MKAQFKPANQGVCTLALALASFMQVLDTTIANVSLPTIAGNLGVSTDQSTWVITAFAVSAAIALPLTGWLTRRFGEVRLFVASTLLFTIASLLCGLAFNMGGLVAFRTLQGFVAGPMYPITQALLISIYPPSKRSQALALLATVTVVAPIAGPILGGWITDNYSWPWIFFINVPVGLFVSFMIWKQMKNKPVVLEKPRMDYVGLITLVLGVGALQLVLDKGNEEDWFNSNFIIASSIVSVVALAVFLIWELTEKEPIVDLKLFRHRNFSAGTFALSIAFGGFFAIGLLIPQWLQTQLHYTAVWSGLAASPLGFLPILLTPFVGKYANKFDLRLLASLAFLVMSASCFYRSGFTSEIDFAHIAWVQFAQGLGVAFFFMPIMSILLSDLEGHEIASGAGLATFMRTLGGSFAASITTYLWGNRAVVHHAQLSEALTPFSSITQSALQQLGDGKQLHAAAQLERLVTQQAYQISFNEICYGLGWLFLSLIAFLWIAKPPFNKASKDTVSGGH